MEHAPVLTLVLDAEHSAKYQHYYLYRGLDRGEAGARPIIDGLYILRETLSDPPPARLRLTLTPEP